MMIATQGFGGIGLATLGYGVGTGVTKEGGAARGVIRRLPLRQLMEIINHPDAQVTSFQKAFIRASKEAVIQEEIKTGRLQGVGDLGRLTDEDLTLILLLMME